MNIAGIGGAVLVATACTTTTPPPLEPITPAPGEPTCEDMCERLTLLGCEEAKPTPAGATCEDVCQATLEAGQDIHIRCVVAVERCSQVDSASQGCSGKATDQ